MTEPIRGRVARILNTRELVINKGADHGVEIGMRFSVFDPKGENVTDPDSGDVLGSVARTKVHVVITSVSPRLSIARTDDYVDVNVGGDAVGLSGIGAFSRMLTPPRIERRYRTLKTSESTWVPLEESESYVKTGDPVVQVTEDTEGVLAE